MTPSVIKSGPTRAPDSSRSGAIDCWRAIACLSVVAYHASECTAEIDRPHLVIATLSHVFRHGWLGVPVFFIISGYCLAQTIELRVQRPRVLLSFWADRLLRIFPVYWAALVLAMLLDWGATPFNGLPAESAFPSTPQAWFANLTLCSTWMAQTVRLTVAWSLEFEIGFYVLLGFAILLAPAQRLFRLVYYLGLTIIAHLPGMRDWAPILSQWPHFACGLAIYFAREKSLHLAARMIALLYPILVAGYYLWTSEVMAAFAPLVSLAILASLAIEPPLRLPLRYLGFIGVASYSIYLIHIPVMSPIMNLAKRLLPIESTAFMFVWLAQLALGVGAGLLFYLFVERQCERFRRRLIPRHSK